jgi:hypothetical protein
MQLSALSEKNRSFAIILPKLFLILAVVFSMWIVIVVSGQLFMEYSSTWTGLSLSFWLILISALFGAFIVIDIIIYAHPTLLTEMNTSVKPMASLAVPFEMKEGKRVYDFTVPKDVKGGLFSKTYIALDEETVLRVRHQIVPSKTLWDKKEKQDNE